MIRDINQYGVHIKPKSNAALNIMTRVKLIDYIRVLEHNYNVAVDFNERQARNIEQMIKDGRLIYNFEFMKKYGVDISGGMPNNATAMEEICRRTYNKGWMDCKATMDGRNTRVGEWIPCSIMLPNHPDQVLITIKWNSSFDDDYEVTLGEYWGEEYGWGFENGEVLAWMSLPEPYKE